MTTQQKQRKRNALERLETQLESGTKKVKFDVIELKEDDVKRIKKEIEILKTRI